MPDNGRVHQGVPEHFRGRGVPQFQRTQRTGDPETIAAAQQMESFLELSRINSTRVQQLCANRLESSSQTSYCTGTAHFERFLLTRRSCLANLNNHSPWSLIGEGFVIFLSYHTKPDGYPLKSTTIAEYQSHAVSAVQGRSLIFESDEFYFRTHGIMKGLAKRDLIYYPPLRLRQKLSITLTIIDLILAKFSLNPDPHLVNFLKAAVEYGWSLSLRPGNYTELLKENNGHRLTTEVFFFIFDPKAAPINVCDSHLFPPDTEPLYFAILPDFAKNHQCGSAPMRAVPANPDKSPGARCLCRSIFKFFSNPAYCPERGQRIFSKFQLFSTGNIRNMLERLLKDTATENGLPPDLMVLHGFRVGIDEQLSGESDADRDAAGGWTHSTKSIGGRQPYVRMTVPMTIAWADRIARSLYNLSATSTIAQLIWMHTTPTSTAANEKRKRLAEINERQQKSSAASLTRNSSK